MATKANEVSREELLLRDVKIQFDELRALRAENQKLKEENEQLKHDIVYTKRQNTEFKNYINDSEREEKQELGFYIKSQREGRKLSYREFARIMGVNHATVMNYENGEGKLKNIREFVEQIQIKFRRG
jgi:DNA-binding transcriptional regulator YiaG